MRVEPQEQKTKIVLKLNILFNVESAVAVASFNQKIYYGYTKVSRSAHLQKSRFVVQNSYYYY